MAILFRSKDKSGESGSGATNKVLKYILMNEKVGKGEIKALHVEVKKSTHKKSCIIAEQVHVNEHYGEIVGGDVEINYIKGGRVAANTVKVNSLQDGEIKANHIHINDLGSNNKIISANTIEINNIKGVKNSLVIKPPIDENILNKLSNLYDRVTLFKKELNKTSDQLEQKLKDIEGQKRDAQMHMAEIEKMRQEGNIPNIDSLMCVKEFNMSTREYDTLIEAIKGLERYIKEDEYELTKLQDDIILNNKIIINSSCKENNNILFVLPECELEYNIAKHDNISEIYLKYIGNNKFQLEIKRREEQQ
ncbi:MAG: hypothetical protein LBT96_01570 [Campylobacteraceae bacterium]|jgi:hypothetical protein|nr:hypothetical protein [Campylobacteraceae bacterium]